MVIYKEWNPNVFGGKARVPVLRYEVEVVGSQFYGCILQYIDNCDIQFALPPVSALVKSKTP